MRNKGIDLLRIVSMIMVLFLHVLGKGGILGTVVRETANYQIAWLIEIAAYCAVDCYGIISGYVGVDSKFKYSNIIQLWCRVAFYTLIITGIFSWYMPQTVRVGEWMKALFPVLGNQYWYFTAYFCLFFFTPFLNYLLQTMTDKQLKKLLFFIILLNFPTSVAGGKVEDIMFKIQKAIY